MCAVHICEVPLQDILRTSGLIADKAHTEDSNEAVVSKDVNQTSTAEALVDDNMVDKKSVKPKKSRHSADSTADDKVSALKRTSVSEDKIRRRRQRQRSSETRDGVVSDKFSLSVSQASGLSTLVNTELTAKETVSEQEHKKHQQQHSKDLHRDRFDTDKISSLPSTVSPPDSAEQIGKDKVPEKEYKRRRSRQSAEVRNVATTLQNYLVGDHLRCRSGPTCPPRVDTSFGSEAVEDMIQRLLDNDELIDDTDQAGTVSTAYSSAVDSHDTKRGRDVLPKKSGKSPRSTAQPTVSSQPSVKSPRSSVTHAVATSQASVKVPGSASDTSLKSPRYAVLSRGHWH